MQILNTLREMTFREKRTKTDLTCVGDSPHCFSTLRELVVSPRGARQTVSI